MDDLSCSTTVNSHEGMQAQMKLAGLAVQSVLLGLYASLVGAMTFFLLNTKGSERRKNCALLAGLVLLSAMITGYWICVVIRAFEAFITWHGGLQASAFYADSTSPSSVAREAFHKATIVVSDAFVIHRLHVVWNRSKIVTAGPMLSLIGTIVSSIGATYAFGAYDASSPSSVSSLLRWHFAQTSFTLSINIYLMIFWRIWITHHETARYTTGSGAGSSIMSVALLMIESASCYTWVAFLSSFRFISPNLIFRAIVIVSQITYATGHVSNYFFTDCIPSVAALAAILVHARAVLGKVVKIDPVAGNWGQGARFNTELVRTRALATDELGRGQQVSRSRANLTPSLASFEAREEAPHPTFSV